MLITRVPQSYINRYNDLKMIQLTNSTCTATKFPYPSTLPFDIDMQKTPVYEISVLYQAWCIALFGWYLGNCDTIITGVMIHLAAQFRILNNAILNVVNRAEMMTYGVRY